MGIPPPKKIIRITKEIYIFMFWSNIITAGSTFVLAIITLFYLLETRQTRKTTQKMLKLSNTPEIKVALLYSHREINVLTIDLYIENIGTGHAYDIQFTGDFKEFQPELTEKPLGEFEIIKDGISHLAPGRRYQTELVWDCKKKENLPKEKRKIFVSYQDSAGKINDRMYPFDFEKAEGFIQMGDPSLDSIAVSLKSIQKDLSEIKKKYTLNSNT